MSTVHSLTLFFMMTMENPRLPGSRTRLSLPAEEVSNLLPVWADPLTKSGPGDHLSPASNDATSFCPRKGGRETCN